MTSPDSFPSPVYITSLGKFLPGDPVGNDEMEGILGMIGGKPSKLREKILESNRIQTRYYAIDDQQRTVYQNCEMAAHAVRDALERSSVGLSEVELLATGTSHGDLVVPGFGSMVHGELGIPSCEIASLQGVCASGVQALQAAYHQVQVGAKRNAVVCASELPSRLFKASRYETQDRIQAGKRLSFDTEFLRWMLSDGAGAAVLQPTSNARGLSLRIDWIELRSFADRYDTCMYAGANKLKTGELGPTWLDYPSFQDAAAAGAINLKQDTRMLDDLVKVGIDLFFELIERGKVSAAEIDWFVGHYSSHVFREKILEQLKSAGVSVPEEKWFTNLYSRGNTGAASPFLLLEELFNEQPLQPGERVLCMVPESGRFTIAYMMLTVVGEASEASAAWEGAREAGAGASRVARVARPPVEPPELNLPDDPLRQSLIRQLARVWIEFEAKLRHVPIIDKLERGRMTRADYQLLLVNLRQQVIEGARWIARAASSIDMSSFPIRSLFLSHAHDEHRDFQMLERDYVAVGGELETILSSPKNVGSEAFSAWMFHRASQPNPFDLLGAMFIIEGLGARLARRWGELIRDQLELTPGSEGGVSFLLYHSQNDENHMARLEAALSSDLLTESVAASIVKTAKVTARLYRLQLEELGQV